MERSSREAALQGAFAINLINFRTNLMIARKICEAVSLSTEGFLKPLRRSMKDEVAKMNQADWDELKKTFTPGAPRPPETRKVILDFADAVVLSHRAPKFTNEMSLEFVVSSFEAFLTNDVKAVLDLIPGLLERRDKTMTFEELLGVHSMDDLKDALIENVIRGANGGGPEDFRRYIKSGMKFDIAGGDWEVLCEYFQRRNLLVHNDLYPDRKYLAQVSSAKKGERLDIGDDYLRRGFDLFGNYAESITKQFHSQYCRNLPFATGNLIMWIKPEDVQAIIMKFIDDGSLP